MRRFATSARAFLKIVWDGMKKDPFWENKLRTAIEANNKLAGIQKAKVK